MSGSPHHSAAPANAPFAMCVQDTPRLDAACEYTERVSE